MTVIVAYQWNGETWIGCDMRIGRGGDGRWTARETVVKWTDSRHYWLAISGMLLMNQDFAERVIEAEAECKKAGLVLHSQRLKRLYGDYCIEISDRSEKTGTKRGDCLGWLLAADKRHGTILRIAADGSCVVSEPCQPRDQAEAYDAIGSGAVEAMGALFAIYDLKNSGKLSLDASAVGATALRAAISMDTGCGMPFWTKRAFPAPSGGS